MLVLGLVEGRQGGAAVAVDDRLVAWAPAGPTDAADDMPWSAAERALQIAGLSCADVDIVSVAGRYTPMFLRKRPLLRRMLEAPFTRMLDATVALRSALRQSGIGAFDADATAEWLDGRLRERGYNPRRTMTVDVHRALAEAAYRLQPADEALVVTVHPMGDGAAMAVHVGRSGQLDRVYAQAGFDALHTHLVRVMAALGLRVEQGVEAVAALGASGQVSDEAVRLLQERLFADAGRLSRGGGARSEDALFAALRALSPEDAAASVIEHLGGVVADVVEHHARAQGIGHVSLAGGVLEAPAIVAKVAELDVVRRITVLPAPGHALLPIGAAACEAGLSPHLPDWLLGPAPDDAEIDEVVKRARLNPRATVGLIARLSAGEAVPRFRGRPGPDRLGLGARCVLVRPDDRAALDAARAALRLEAHTPARVLVRAGAGDLRWARPEVVGRCTSWATACVRPEGAGELLAACGVGGGLVVQEVEAAQDPGLFRLLDAAAAAWGTGALAALPFAEADGPVATDPAHAVEIWRRAGLGAMQLGGLVVEASP